MSVASGAYFLFRFEPTLGRFKGETRQCKPDQTKQLAYASCHVKYTYHYISIHHQSPLSGPPSKGGHMGILSSAKTSPPLLSSAEPSVVHARGFFALR